ncbi:hypothetical protein HY357_02585, partial [Candidatus Roizmanbacteria bacterium]|nr:hypothetical protein [Candidatus Roizmanbacteria bacterium]
MVLDLPPNPNAAKEHQLGMLRDDIKIAVPLWKLFDPRLADQAESWIPTIDVGPVSRQSTPAHPLFIKLTGVNQSVSDQSWVV